MQMLEVRQTADRGQAVYAASPLKGGQVVISEGPIVLYPHTIALGEACAYCLRVLRVAGPGAVGCTGCQAAGFCSAACAAAAAADPGSHCALVCRALVACDTAGLAPEQLDTLQYLVRCASLWLAAQGGDAGCAARYAALAALAGHAPEAEAGGLQDLHGRLCTALVAAGVPAGGLPSLQEAADLVRKDEVNGYGIMAPSGPDGSRVLRGAALYAQASRVNHECLPNAARFDRFDEPGGPPGSNTTVHLRMLHDLPAGEEVTQSYFPLPWPLSDRQASCQETYGFACACPRCKEEATWGGSEDGIGEEEAAPAPSEPPPGEADAAYINIFLLKYVCPHPDCFGTMAPVAPGSDACECSMCGRTRTEAEFLAELDAME